MVLIRRLEIDDALADFFETLSDETLYWQNRFGKDAREKSIYVEISEKNADYQNPYVVIENEKIIAYGWLGFGRKPEQRFTCSLGIVVTDKFQNKGIGTQLTKFMIEEARKLKMRKIFLNCYTTNERAFKLYTKLGFEIEGIFRKQEWTKDNLALDLYSMAKFLE